MKSQAVSWWPSAYRPVSPAFILPGEASRDIINTIGYPATSERPSGQERAKNRFRFCFRVSFSLPPSIKALKVSRSGVVSSSAATEHSSLW